MMNVETLGKQLRYWSASWGRLPRVECSQTLAAEVEKRSLKSEAARRVSSGKIPLPS
jgi:hypothetical protein